MLEHLGWDTLKGKQTIPRLQMLFKILHNEYSFDIPHHYLPQTRRTSQYHPLHFIITISATLAYQHKNGITGNH